MELGILWSTALSLALGLTGWALRTAYAEVHRLGILLNKTREEMAKDYVTKSEAQYDISRVMDRLDALDGKLDRMLERKS
jgi:hypothetical protein